VEIRNPDRTHLPAVFELLGRCFDGAWNEAELSDRIFYDPRYDPNHVWMAREKGQILGFLVSVQDYDRAWLKLLAVDPGARRKGLGRDLLSRAEFRLSGEGVRVLNIAPSPPRDFLPGLEAGSEAALFFESQGFAAGDPYAVGWTRADSAAPSAAAGDLDLPAAVAFAKARCGSHWPWAEDQLSHRPARAAFDPAAGLCLLEPGESLGPLWAAPGAPGPALDALFGAALAQAGAVPARHNGQLRLWQVEGSFPLERFVRQSRRYTPYSKSLV